MKFLLNSLQFGVPLSEVCFVLAALVNVTDAKRLVNAFSNLLTLVLLQMKLDTCCKEFSNKALILHCLK